MLLGLLLPTTGSIRVLAMTCCATVQGIGED